MPSTPQVLLLCMGNPVGSQLAEALLRRRAGGRLIALGVGRQREGVRPLTLTVS